MEKLLLLKHFIIILSFLNVQTQQQSTQRLGFNMEEFSTAAPNTDNDNQTIIKVAMLIGQNTTDYGLARSNAILCNVGGAIPMALERLWNEGILPKSVNFSFQWRFDRCKRSRDVGYSYQFIRYYGADAIIPPSCIEVPPTIGQLASNTNIPMILWGPVMAQKMSNWDSYNTLINIVPNYKSMSILIMEMFRYFNWTQFAIVFQSDLGVSAGCNELAQSIDSAKNSYQEIRISYKVRIFNMASINADSIINQLKMRARIILLCFDDIVQQRIFALKLYDKEMNTNEYVYILPDYDLYLSFNLTRLPFWVQNRGNLNSSVLLDGRDADAEAIGQLSFRFHYDIALSDVINSEYNGYFTRVLQKAQGWPFYCDTSKLTNGSIYSMLLYDAIYNYGLALNASFSKYGISPDVYRNGTLISENGKRTFMGMTGLAVIENNGNSRALVLSRMKQKEEGDGFRIVLQFALNNGKVNITMRNSSALWLSPYKGAAPLSVPLCGFDGNGCPISPFDAYKGYIIAGIALIVLIIIGIVYLIAYIIYSRIRNNEQKNLLWQISFVSLTRIKEKMRSQTERSERSIHSGPSASTFGTNNSSNNVALSKGLALYLYNGEKCVGQKHGPTALVQLTEMDMAELRTMRMLDHENLNRFYGLSLDSMEAISVWKFCSRGSIRDMIASGNALTKDQVFVHSILSELCEGLAFLHNSDLQFHGRLRSSCCLVDERWKVKISQFGLRRMKNAKKQTTKDLLWKAPEQLRSVPGDDDFMEGTKQADIYTLGLIFTEVVNMRPCWEENEEDDEREADGNNRMIDTVEASRMNIAGRQDRTANQQSEQRGGNNIRHNRSQRNQHRQARNAEEILYLVKRGGLVPLRPTIRPAIEGLDPTLVHLIRECWAEEASDRPTIRQIRETLRSISRGQQSTNLMDHVFNMLEQYANKLEEEVEERTRELAGEKKKSDLLLYRMLPRQIADRLKIGQSVEPEHYDCVTVFFSDVVAFAAISKRMRPLQVVMLMNDLYTVFDSIINEHDVYKVESIGDGYLCVSGLPKRNGNQHVKECADMALQFMRSLDTFHDAGLPSGECIRLRIGLHSGSCMAGVVGLAMPRYCLFGDTVNTASRMESSSSPNKIHISNDTYQLLAKYFDGYSMENRGEIIIKGKGVMQTFWLLGHIVIGQIQQTNLSSTYTQNKNNNNINAGSKFQSKLKNNERELNPMYEDYKLESEIETR